jgi:hypothetical protein
LPELRRAEPAELGFLRPLHKPSRSPSPGGPGRGRARDRNALLLADRRDDGYSRSPCSLAAWKSVSRLRPTPRTRAVCSDPAGRLPSARPPLPARPSTRPTFAVHEATSGVPSLARRRGREPRQADYHNAYATPSRSSDPRRARPGRKPPASTRHAAVRPPIVTVAGAEAVRQYRISPAPDADRHEDVGRLLYRSGTSRRPPLTCSGRRRRGRTTRCCGRSWPTRSTSRARGPGGGPLS